MQVQGWGLFEGIWHNKVWVLFTIFFNNAVGSIYPTLSLFSIQSGCVIGKKLGVGGRRGIDMPSGCIFLLRTRVSIGTMLSSLFSLLNIKMKQAGPAKWRSLIGSTEGIWEVRTVAI
jgi:hypothetical protein